MKFKEFFSLVLEKDLRTVLIKRGLPEELANYCHNVSNKYAGFVANVLFFTNPSYITSLDRKTEYVEEKRYMRHIPIVNLFINEIFPNQNKPILPNSPNKLTWEESFLMFGQWPTIKDWYLSPLVENKPNIREMKWADAYMAAIRWHEEMAEKAEDKEKALSVQEGQDIVMKFDDGFYWLRLNADHCREEADAMGHCGRASTGELFSLRDVKNVPRITADIDVDGHKAGQIYSKGNTKPPEKYHRKILDLLGTLEVERLIPANYREESLSVDDLSDEDKEWFEEKYGYEIQKAGISDRELKEAQDLIDEYNKKYEFCGIYLGDDSYGDDPTETIYMEFHLDLSSFDVVEDDDDKAIYRNNFDLPSKLYTPFENESTDRDNDTLRWSGSDYYNTERGTDRQGYSMSFVKWVDGLCEEIRQFDEKIKENYGLIISELIEQGFIHSDEHTELIHLVANEDNTFVTIDGTSVYLPVLKFNYSDEHNKNYHDDSPLYNALFKSYPEEQDDKIIQHYINYINKHRIIDLFFLTARGENQLVFDFIKYKKLAKTSEPIFKLEANKEKSYYARGGTNVFVVSKSILELSEKQLRFIRNVVKNLEKDLDYRDKFLKFVHTVLGKFGAMRQKRIIKTDKDKEYVDDETGILEKYLNFSDLYRLLS